MMLLKVDCTWHCPTASTTTFFFFFFSTLAMIRIYGAIDYLTAFFLFATVLRLPLRVRELFLVDWPRNGRPKR